MSVGLVNERCGQIRDLKFANNWLIQFIEMDGRGINSSVILSMPSGRGIYLVLSFIISFVVSCVCASSSEW